MKKNLLISFSVFIAGLCSIIYELLVSTAATYFLGDGVKQFSITIGIYLFSMGIGAYFSKFNQNRPLRYFITIEFLLGLIGGLSIPFLYFLFVNVSIQQMQFMVWLIIFIIGLLTGMEVPLLTYAVTNIDFKESLSNILSLDYIGGLAATLLFPFILLPFIGLFYSSLIFGLINIALGFLLVFVAKEERTKGLYFLGSIAAITLLVMVAYTSQLLGIWEEKIYKAPIIHKEQTSHQKIVMTKEKEDVRLFLNRVIQFSSLDEHRYHESLVHFPMLLHDNPKRVLVLGGGENLAAREILKHASVEIIDVVDLDSAIFHLAKTDESLIAVNDSAAFHPKVNLIVGDAFNFLKNDAGKYDIIIADLPDPNTEATAKLYTGQFYGMALDRLTDDGFFITHAGEIYMSNLAFNCMRNTMSAIFPQTKVLHTYIPSFGDWGFIIGSKRTIEDTSEKFPLPFKTKYLTKQKFENAWFLPKDIPQLPTDINTLDHPVILQYFLEDWEKWKKELKGN